MSIAETLRKHPIAGNAMRRSTADFNVPNTDYTIPKGMQVYIPIYAFHHDEKFFPKPEEFDPDRFCEELPRGAFMPFGNGTCYLFSFFVQSFS